MSGSHPADDARLLPVTLRGDAGPIEGLLQEREGHEHALTAVVCHPHPLYGGTMHNKVAHRVAATLHGLGAAVLRFNFRGVGRSAGAFDRGEGELADARVALAFLRERHPAARRWAAGFSFGSWVASRLAAEPDIERVLLVAPPVHTQPFDEMRTLPTPKLVVQGTDDEVCRPENLERVWPQWAEPKRLVRVPGAGHFFDRRLGELADAIRAGLR
ncbi:MAG: alpha/beta hydrolase [Candidatus Eisenbacteria bacterium]|nr:alpha/beta hydrolase [Candidatus Eisenbacteria bacterium]